MVTEVSSRPSAPTVSFRSSTSFGAKPLPETRLPSLVPPDDRHRCVGGKPARVERRARQHRALRRRHAQARAFRRGHRLLGIGFGVRGGRHAPRCHAEHERGSRQVRVGRLFMIQIALTHVAGQHAELMLADRTGRAKTRDRRTVRVGRRDPAHFLVVPVDHPRALHRPPSEALHAKFDRRADGSFGGVHLERLADLDAALGERHAVVGDEQFVNAAVVFGNLEMRGQTAVVSRFRLSQ